MSAWIKKSSIFRWLGIVTVGPIAMLLAIGFSMLASAVTRSDNLQLQGASSPVRLSAMPGTVASADITIRNVGKQAENLNATVRSLSQDSSGNPTFSSKNEKNNYLDEAVVTPSDLTLLPNEQRTVRIAITVPNNAAAGYYFAVVFSRLSSGDTVSDNVPGATYVTPVLVETGTLDTNRQLAVENFSPQHGIAEFLPVSFAVTLKNTGNVTAVPHGDITIRQDNRQLARVTLNPRGEYILPGLVRTFTVQWNDGFPRTVTNSQEKPTFEVNWSNFGRFRIGPYAADLTMIYDDGHRDVVVQKSASFAVVPWTLLVGIFIVIAFLVWVVVSNVVTVEQLSDHRSRKVPHPRKKPLKPPSKPLARKKTKNGTRSKNNSL